MLTQINTAFKIVDEMAKFIKLLVNNEKNMRNITINIDFY